MARKQIKIVHPLAAIEALTGYHGDIGILLVAVQTAISMMANKDHDARRVCDAVAPELEKAAERVRRWYEQP